MRMQDRARLGAELAGALQRRELQVVYQPQIRLADGAVSGVEALARWQSPVLGDVEPENFIPVAEEAGLIGEIGGWVMQTALAGIQSLAPAPALRLAVNVSVRQLRDLDFPARVAGMLGAAAFPPQRLELEITEGHCLLGEAALDPRIAALRRLGVSVVLDDFGAGYSNLATLGRFDFDRLKLDRSLIRDLHGTIRGERIIEWAVSMASGLGLEVIAEGVETATQADYLRRIGCTFAQGFLYAPPLTLGELATWLGDRNPMP